VYACAALPVERWMIFGGHSAARIAAARLRRCQLKVKCVLVTLSGTQGTRAAGARRGRTEVQLVLAPNAKRLSALRSAAPWPPQPHPPPQGHTGTTAAPPQPLAARRRTVKRADLARESRPRNATRAMRRGCARKAAGSMRNRPNSSNVTRANTS
jgi:hypothetical protein